MHLNASQWELFLLKVNNRETIAVIEANNETYCLQQLIEKFLLVHMISKVQNIILLNNYNFNSIIRSCIVFVCK